MNHAVIVSVSNLIHACVIHKVSAHYLQAKYVFLAFQNCYARFRQDESCTNGFSMVCCEHNRTSFSVAVCQIVRLVVVRVCMHLKGRSSEISMVKSKRCNFRQQFWTKGMAQSQLYDHLMLMILSNGYGLSWYVICNWKVIKYFILYA